MELLKCCLPFYFPTKVVHVDDDEQFLSRFRLVLSRELGRETYHDPRRALSVINTARSRTEILSRCFSDPVQHNLASKRYEHPGFVELSVNVEAIAKAIYQHKRYEEVSVVLVDYAMPQMDGLEFCRQISNPYVKTILLTGQADTEIAVEAFNEGLIDHYIRKDDPDIVDKINEAIHRFQRQYFVDLALPVLEALTAHERSYLRDEAFFEYFTAKLKELDIVEYYLVNDPEGYLMVTRRGELKLLMLADEHEMSAHFEMAVNEGAPLPLLEAIESQRFIPYFLDGHRYFSAEKPQHRQNWESYLYPADLLHGISENYLAAVINATHLIDIDQDNLSDYRHFLDNLNQKVSA